MSSVRSYAELMDAVVQQNIPRPRVIATDRYGLGAMEVVGKTTIHFLGVEHEGVLLKNLDGSHVAMSPDDVLEKFVLGLVQ